MAIWIRKIKGDTSENYLKLADGDWNLRTQFEVFESWLKCDAGNLKSDEMWIADIGFAPREGALGGGPIISLEMMKICLDKQITIYLSEYEGVNLTV